MEEMKKYEAFAKKIVEHAARKGLTVGEFRAAADLAKRIVNESAVGYGIADGFDFARPRVLSAADYIMNGRLKANNDDSV